MGAFIFGVTHWSYWSYKSHSQRPYGKVSFSIPMVTRVTFFLGAVQIGVGIVFNTRGYGGLMCGEGKGCR